MNILDQILDNHEAREGAAVIVSQEHDTDRITWRNGMFDVAEMLKVSARAGETVEQAGIRAGLARAQYDTSNGRVNFMSAGKLPWSGLGVILDRICKSGEAIVHAGQDWIVLKLPMSHQWQGATVESSDTFALVRADTGRKLGTVGSKYQPIQNVQAFEFLDGVLEEYGARYETAGSLYGGKQVFMVAKFPEQAFSVNGRDACEPYVVFSNPHDGSGAAWCYPTTVRVECANTLSTSARDHGKGLSIRHTGNVKDKIKAARNALGFAVEGFDEFREAAEEMSRRPMEIRHYAADVLDAVLDITQAECAQGADALSRAIARTEAERELAAKSFAKKIERRGEILHDILERHASEANGVNGMRGTAWGCFNTFTEHADHATIGRQASDPETRASRRFESAMVGAGDEMKQAAYRFATA